MTELRRFDIGAAAQALDKLARASAPTSTRSELAALAHLSGRLRTGTGREACDGPLELRRRASACLGRLLNLALHDAVHGKLDDERKPGGGP